MKPLSLGLVMTSLPFSIPALETVTLTDGGVARKVNHEKTAMHTTATSGSTILKTRTRRECRRAARKTVSVLIDGTNPPSEPLSDGFARPPPFPPSIVISAAIIGTASFMISDG